LRKEGLGWGDVERKAVWKPVEPALARELVLLSDFFMRGDSLLSCGIPPQYPKRR
jgi:hypothetical protein